MTNSMVDVHSAYVKVYQKCQDARACGKEYIGIQVTRTGYYRLIATNRQPNEGCVDLTGFAIRDWAQNVMYRLANLGWYNAGKLDAYFDDLDTTGYEVIEGEQEQ